MIRLRKSSERGYADHGWLQSFHSFSFADYHDPQHMAWGNLRVINEDRIAPGSGFGRHGHRDMEIITYIAAGELTHEDSLGNGAVITAGEVQHMSAGRGVVHSEFNHSSNAATHLFQIWIEPASTGIEPGYAQRIFSAADKSGRLARLASPDGADGSLRIHADASFYAGLLNGADVIRLALDPHRKAYVHLARGRLTVNGQPLASGDAALLADETQLLLEGAHDAEVLVFDLAA